MMFLKIEGRFVVFSHNLREVVIICPNFKKKFFCRKFTNYELL